MAGDRPEHAGDPRDEDLVARVARGDVAACATLYDRYAQAVYAWAAHALGPARAEDVVQDVFLRLWTSAGQYDAERAAFRTWFFAIARHAIGQELRRLSEDARARAVGEIDAALGEVVDRSTDVEEEAWQRARGQAVRRALQNLPDEQRRVLVLAYFGGFSQSTLARSLGWPLGTVKKRIHLGLRKLRDLVGDALDGPPQPDAAGEPGLRPCPPR